MVGALRTGIHTNKLPHFVFVGRSGILEMRLRQKVFVLKALPLMIRNEGEVAP